MRQQIPDSDLDETDKQWHRSTGHPSRENIEELEDSQEFNRRIHRRNTY